MKKRVVCAFLGLVMMVSQSFTVFADTESDIRQQKAQAESQLSQTNDTIASLSEQQQQIQSEINAMDADMVDLMIQIDATKTDIASTEDGIAQKEADITEKEGEIETTAGQLQDAEADRDKQYADMKKRIQYIYENGGNEAWLNMLSGADSITSLLNKVEYAQNMHDYDRKQLEAFKEVVQQVSDLKADLENQKADLETQKSDLETQKASLESQQADLQSQQADLQAQMDEKKATSSDYEAQIATAQQQANEISNLISQQQAQLDQIAEEKRQAEEEAARQAAAEEAARQQAAAEEAARQQAASNRNNSSSSSSNSSSNSNKGNSSNKGTSNNAPSYVSGDAVSRAYSALGKPYVWGATGPNSFDCSGLVGFCLTGRYSRSCTSASLNALPTVSNPQPGDVCVRSGHCGIYIGNGQMIHAPHTGDVVKVASVPSNMRIVRP